MQIHKHFFFLICFTALCLACETKLDEELLTSYTNEDVFIERMEEVEILYSDSAQVRVRITAPKMLRHLKRGEARQEFTEGLYVEFFDEYNRVNGSLRAKYGIRYESLQEIVVQDSVVWKNQNSDKLETEELTWNERQGKITTNKFVVITRPDEVVYGHGFEAEQDFSNASIRAVEGRIKVQSDL